MNNRISFNAKNVSLPNLDYDYIADWLERVAADHGRLLGPVSYLFVDDEEILAVNRQFLQHDYYTDIITFDYCTCGMLRGDMVISLDTVASNAEQFGADRRIELLRVIVHGLLHLCGIDDKAPGAREIMEANENRALAMADVSLAWRAEA